jgi:phenylalanyl-tRNA synthetase beta chain
MVGLAVDSVEDVAGGDYVLDVEVPSNRPDCLSHVGIAREVSVIERGSVRLPLGAPSRLGGLMKDFASVEIEDSDLCPRYAARVVRGVKIGPSPDWLVRRLEAIGQRPINNVADITNYVLHELGQPLHAFDLSLLAGRRIVVRRARAGEKIKTLDGVERELDAEVLVIADAARAVALAGVMGGEETEINDATRDVLIESAYFAPASVRRTARSLGLNTEASYRFERGTDYAGVLRAQERCVQLICDLAGGTATEDSLDVYKQPFAPRGASLRPRRVEALTGLRVQTSEIIRILEALGLERRASEGGDVEKPDELEAIEGLNARDDEKLTFVVPSWRADIALEEDLVEEVARHTGYEKIATELPLARSAGEYQPSEARRRAMRQALVTVGYDEAINLSFIDTTHDERFALVPALATAAAKTEERFITLSNAIIEGATRMRATLLPGLLDAVRYNFNHGTRDVRLFETGRVFVAHETRGQLPFEREAFALVATGGDVLEGRAGAARELDFYDLKGALELAADAMKIGPLRFESARAGHLREGQSARVLVEGQAVGTIGRLDETIAAAYRFRQPVYVAEVDFDALLEAREPSVLYKPLARYPSIVRDVSLLIERDVTLSELLGAVSEQELEYCREAKLVGVYEGEGVPEGKRSVTLRLEYRAEERTLRDEEVDELHARIVGALEEKFGAQLRG